MSSHSTYVIIERHLNITGTP